VVVEGSERVGFQKVDMDVKEGTSIAELVQTVVAKHKKLEKVTTRVSTSVRG
jgi:molybdopterin converting factor small subunit